MDDEIELETKEKQEYLRVNILEKGYNADEFMEYLEVLGGEKGLEIRNWSKNDLVKAVHDFQLINEKGKNDPISLSINKNNINNKLDINNKDDNINNIKEDPKENINNQNNINIINNENKINNKQNEQEYINCNISETTPISKRNDIVITISDPQKMEGGIFSKGYITYLVKTDPLKFEVRRRFTDFEWLREILMNQYINCIIPPVYKKSYFMGLDDYAINKRIGVLQRFIREILAHPLLRNSQIFYDFISIKNKNEFNNKKNIYNALSFPTKIEEMKSLSGEINVEINSEKSALAENIKTISKSNDELLKKLSKEYKELNYKIFEFVSKIKNVAKIWNELYKVGNQNLEGDMILGIYDVMGKLMEDWAKMEEKQIELINKKIREYFRYIRKEYKCIKEYYYKYEEAKNTFIKDKIKLIDTKEYFFENEDFKNWGLNQEDLDDKMLLLKNKDYAMSKMLPEETRKLKEDENIYGSYLNCLVEEYQKIQNLNKIRHKESVLEFIKGVFQNLTYFQVSLTNLISFIDVMKEDMYIN